MLVSSTLTNVPNSAEPTAAETAAALAKEKEEQASLPYKWTQTIGDIDVTITGLPGNYKGKDLVVEIKKQKLVAGVKGQDPIINVHTVPLDPSLLSGSILLYIN